MIIRDSKRWNSGASRAINPAEFAIIVRVWIRGGWRRGFGDNMHSSHSPPLVRTISIFAGKLDRWTGTTRLTTDIPKRLIPRAIGYACESAQLVYTTVCVCVCVCVSQKKRNSRRRVFESYCEKNCKSREEGKLNRKGKIKNRLLRLVT